MEHDIQVKVGDVTSLLSEAIYVHSQINAIDDGTRTAVVLDEDNETGRMFIETENTTWEIRVTREE